MPGIDYYDPGEINIDLFKWRPILRNVYTLREYDEHYSLKDVCDAHEALDLQDENEEWQQQKMAREMPKK